MQKNHASNKGKFLSVATNIVAQNSSKVPPNGQHWIYWQHGYKVCKVFLPFFLLILQPLQLKPVSGCVETARRIKINDFEVEQSNKICNYATPNYQTK